MENQTFQSLTSADLATIQGGRNEHYYKHIGYSHSLNNPLWRIYFNSSPSSDNKKNQP